MAQVQFLWVPRPGEFCHVEQLYSWVWSWAFALQDLQCCSLSGYKGKGCAAEVLGVWDRNSEHSLPHSLQLWEMVCFKGVECIKKCLKFGGQHVLWSSYQSMGHKLCYRANASESWLGVTHHRTQTHALMAAVQYKHHVAATDWQPFLGSSHHAAGSELQRPSGRFYTFSWRMEIISVCHCTYVCIQPDTIFSFCISREQQRVLY